MKILQKKKKGESLPDQASPVEGSGNHILAKFKHALVIDFEAIPNGDIFHAGPVLTAALLKKKISKTARQP